MVSQISAKPEKKSHVIASQCAHWRGNPVDFLPSSNGRIRKIPGIATGFALAMTCSFWLVKICHTTNGVERKRAVANFCNSPSLKT